MASVKVSFHAVNQIGGTNVFGPARIAETLTSSGTTQQSTNGALQNEFVTVTASGGAVHITVGQNPTAAATAGYMLQDGGEKTVGPLNAGDEVAILDV